MVGLFSFLFDFAGRIPRLWWWGGSLVIALFYGVHAAAFLDTARFLLANVGLALVEAGGPGSAAASDLSVMRDTVTTLPAPSFVDLFLYFIGILLLILSSLAINVKRLHDRDKSGWWYLLMFLPLIGPLWLFVELGFLAGSTGTNDYGPDPRVSFRY